MDVKSIYGSRSPSRDNIVPMFLLGNTSTKKAHKFTFRFPPWCIFFFLTVPDEAAVGNHADAERSVFMRETAVPQHVGLSPRVVEPHVECEHDLDGAVQLYVG